MTPDEWLNFWGAFVLVWYLSRQLGLSLRAWLDGADEFEFELIDNMPTKA